MTPREQIQAAYELAFFPPRVNALWNRLKKGETEGHAEWGRLVDQAIALHLALPDSGFSSPQALHRLAYYQARSRAYAMPRCLYVLRKRLGVPGDPPSGTVPGAWVRDIGLPEFSRHKDVTS